MNADTCRCPVPDDSQDSGVCGNCNGMIPGPTSEQHWTEFTPQQAKDFTKEELDKITRPFNEMGDPCPWPWEPQQMVGAPIGQYHCPYCGAMVLAGMEHLDYKDVP